MDVNFSEVFSENLNRLGVPLSDENKRYYVGSGVRVNGMVLNTAQGNLVKTDNNLDFAIEGEGFFKVINENGEELYTRNGNFKIDGNGNIVDSLGNKLEITLNQQNIDLNNINILEDGQILYNGQAVGNIKIYKFESDDSISAIGSNLYKGENPQISSAKIKQGYIESSNVDIAKELTDLLITQRAFEMNSRALKSSEEMWQMTNNLRGR